MTRERVVRWARQVVSRPVVRALRPVLMVLAFAWRRMLVGTTFVAITGSAGKTTTKECLAAVLARKGRTSRSYRTQNTPLMVALNVLRVRPWHRYAVVEAAGATPGMIAPAAKILRPDVAIVLNVMRHHVRAFADIDAYAREKAALLDYIAPNGLAVLNTDDARVAQMAVPPGVRAVRFGAASDADFRVDDARGAWPERFSFALTHGGATRRIDTQLVGTQWLSGMAAVMAAAVSLGVDAETASAALGEVPPFAGRLEPRTLPSGAILLRDDIGAPVDTIEPSFRVLREAVASRKLLLISDMVDYGMDRRDRLKFLGKHTGDAADCVVFVGQMASYGARRAVDAGIRPENAHAFASLREAADFLRSELRAGDLVLLKGRASDHTSRVFFAQLGTVGCWKDPCRKQMLCDICWELDFRPDPKLSLQAHAVGDELRRAGDDR